MFENVADNVALASGLITGMGIVLAVKGRMYKLKFWKAFEKPVSDINVKLAVVVRDDLSMTLGKQISQVCHAGVDCYIKSYIRSPQILEMWEKCNRPVIVAKLDKGGDLGLIQLQRKARQLGLHAEIIHDAGRTQIKSGTATTIGIGPGDAALIDKVCGHLLVL